MRFSSSSQQPQCPGPSIALLPLGPAGGADWADESELLVAWLLELAVDADDPEVTGV